MVLLLALLKILMFLLLLDTCMMTLLQMPVQLLDLPLLLSELLFKHFIGLLLFFQLLFIRKLLGRISYFDCSNLVYFHFQLFYSRQNFLYFLLAFVLNRFEIYHSLVIKCSNLSIVSSDSSHKLKGLLFKLEGM